MVWGFFRTFAADLIITTTMQGNFSYHNPTKLYFGDESLNYLKDELKNFGPVVLLNYGSGSVKRNGIYDQVVAILKEAGKTVVENAGVMSNPTLEKLREGIKIARENNVDWILALGGGSVCDYSKAVAASVFYDGDYWDKFWLRQEQPDADQKLLPVTSFQRRPSAEFSWANTPPMANIAIAIESKTLFIINIYLCTVR